MSEDISKKNILNEFNILLDTIKDVLGDDNYKDSINYLNEFKEFLESWQNNFVETNSLKNVTNDKLSYFKLETSDFFVKHEDYDLEENCYTEILMYHYSILLDFWKTELEKRGI